MDVKKNGEIISELKDNSNILIFGKEEIIEGISAKFTNSKITWVNKRSDAIKKIKSIKKSNITIIEKDTNEFLNDSEINDLDCCIFNNCLSQEIDFGNRKIYLKVMFKILKKMTKQNCRIIIADEKGAKKVELELIKKVSEKQGLKPRVINDSSSNYLVVLEKSGEEEAYEWPNDKEEIIDELEELEKKMEEEN